MTLQNTQQSEHFIRLVEEFDYPKNVNQIASISTHRILVVKRGKRELAVPMSGCSSILYKNQLAVLPMLSGAILFSIFVFMIWGLFFSGLDIDLHASVPVVGVFAIFPVFSLRLLLHPRRHLLKIIISSKTYKWKSKPGDFKRKTYNVQRAVEFGIKSGLIDPVKSPDAEILLRVSA